MGALLVPLIVLVVILIAVGIGVRAWAARREAVAEDLARPTTSTLDYHVPPGQDPVVVLTALSTEGFSATADPHRTDLVHISCPAGADRDRARVRATIASAHSTAIDTGASMDPTPVRFADEE